MSRNHGQTSSDRAHWCYEETKFFLDLCIAEKNKMNFNQTGLTKLGWRNVYRGFASETGLQLANKKLQNKLSAMRRHYFAWRDRITHTGLGRDPQTGGVTADPSLFQEEEEVTPFIYSLGLLVQ